jgi:oligopeptide transport system substrate-binding protein
MKGWFFRIFLTTLLISLISSTLVACGSKTQISDLAITPNKIAIGQTAKIEAKLFNSGNGEEKYSVTFKIDEKLIETKEITLVGGDRKNVEFFYIPANTGTSNIEVNGLKASLTVVKPPEFQVNNLDISQSQIVAGDDITITAEVLNIGEVERTYTAKLAYDGIETGTKDLLIPSNGTQKVEFKTKVSTAGNHVIKIGDSTKNFKALVPADLKVNSIQVYPEVIFAGQEASIQATVTNTGEVKADLPVSLMVNGVETDFQTISLDPGKEGPVVFKLSRDTSGTFDVGIKGSTTTLKVVESQTYTNSKYSYSVSFPSYWKLDPTNLNSVKIQNPLVVYSTIIVLEIPTNIDQSDFAALIQAENQRAVPEININPGPEQKCGIYYAKRYEYTYTTRGVKGRGCYIVLKTGHYGYVLSCETLDTAWDNNKPLIEALLSSFRVPQIVTANYTDTVNGYSITLPSDWEGVITGDPHSIMNYSSVGDASPVRGSIVIEPLSENSTPKDYANTISASFQNNAGYQVKSQGDINLGLNTRGYEIVFIYSPQGTSVTMRIDTVIRGSQALTLITGIPTSNYVGSQTTIDSFIKSFTIMEPKPYGVSRQDSLFLYQGDIPTLDPAKTEEGPGGITGAIFSGLVKISKDFKAIPDLAEKWDASSDGKVYTFYLRSNAVFQNGKVVTAKDVKYSWERALNPTTGSKKAKSFLGDILGAQDILTGKSTELTGVKIINDRTLQVTIDGPKPYFLDELAQPVAFIVDKSNVAAGANWFNKPNGTGAFKLKQWDKDQILILERNDKFYAGPAKLQNIVFKLFAGRPMMMYENGEIDQISVSTNDLDQVTDPSNPLNKDYVSTTNDKYIEYLGFNVTKAPFDDPKVRQAFGLALNIDKLIEVSLKGNAERSATILPPGIPGYNSELKPMSFDPVLAKKLISESKYGSVDQLPPVIMTVLYGTSPIEDAIIGMWKQNLGITVTVEVVKELKEWYQKRHDRQLQIFLAGWRADYNDPQNFIDVLFQSQSDENIGAYSNPNVDSALKNAAVEQDSSERLKKYQEIEKIILGDFAAIPLYTKYKDNNLIKPYVKGFNLSTMDINIWAEISIISH